MSKQDGYASRTAADLERKYNFGQTFADVYGLLSDAQRSADEANKAVESLDSEEIFNRLTNYGEHQGIYRGEDGGVYINASFIKSGKIEAGAVEVEAATITGQLVATQIDTKDLKVLAANITGTLTAGQIDTTNLKVSSANITGAISFSQLDGSTQTTISNASTNASNASTNASVAASRVNAWTYTGTTMINGSMIMAGTIMASYLQGGMINVNGANGYPYGYMYAGTDRVGTTAFEVYGTNGLRLTSAGNVWLECGGGNGTMGRINLTGQNAYIGPTVYLTNGTLIASDRDLKHDIEYDIAAYDAVFDALKPSRFKYNDGTSDRYHTALIAQDVKDAVLAAGLTTQDFAGYCEMPEYEKDENGNPTEVVTGYSCALRYDEFIALCIRQIQLLKGRVATLEERQ